MADVHLDRHNAEDGVAFVRIGRRADPAKKAHLNIKTRRILTWTMRIKTG